MPRNQTSTQTNATGAGSARAAKPRTPRVTASKHNKAAAAEATIAVLKETPHQEEVREIIASLTEEPRETISKLAYGFWEERAGINGDALTDWVRAEEQYRRSLASID